MFAKRFAASLVLATANAASGYFNYNDIGANWAVDGFHSPDCLAGREQSPINLYKSTFSTESPENKMRLEGSDYTDYPTG